MLCREMRELFLPETAKAIVDDAYLGYIPFADLQVSLLSLNHCQVSMQFATSTFVSKIGRER